MKIALKQEFSPAQIKVLKKGYRLAIISLIYFTSVIVLMYLVMGMSQAMKTAWIEDVLSTIPPAVFLFGNYICKKNPSAHFPYGYHRIMSIAFFTAAISLLGMGMYLFIEGVIKLISAEHPSIGLIFINGYSFWSGWLMIIVLLWGTFPSLFLGVRKEKLAQKICDKVLYTDAKMNKDDWMVGMAAIGSIIGVGFGLWWCDAIAAILISSNIIYDGLKQTTAAITELMDRSPQNLEGEFLTLPQKVAKLLKDKRGVEDSEVRLRDYGHIILGEGIIRVNKSTFDIKYLEEWAKEVEALDWRLHNFILTAVDKFE